MQGNPAQIKYFLVQTAECSQAQAVTSHNEYFVKENTYVCMSVAFAQSASINMYTFSCSQL